MTEQAFWAEMDARIAAHDLLCHPFYRAWNAGELTREDLREYASQYYHHVAAFPGYLLDLYQRLPEGELRTALLENFRDEIGMETGKPHHVIWLQFAQEMGSTVSEARTSEPFAEVRELIGTFQHIARDHQPAAALAAFYAYESQVPRVATEKQRGLRARYGAGDFACQYFDLHITADVYHARVWREQLTKLLAEDPGLIPQAMDSASTAAQALWQALDGIERERQARKLAA